MLRSRRAFTLIELMVTVSILGILAAIAIPSFMSYLARSKTTEATGELRSLFSGAAAYYEVEHTGDPSVTLTAGTRIATSACLVGNAVTSNTPSNSRAVLDWASEPDEFEEIGFSTRDPIYYQYAIAGSDGSCGHGQGEALYSFRAHGDLDADGTTSLLELAAGSDTQNELMHAPGIYMLNPYE